MSYGLLMWICLAPGGIVYLTKIMLNTLILHTLFIIDDDDDDTFQHRTFTLYNTRLASLAHQYQ